MNGAHWQEYLESRVAISYVACQCAIFTVSKIHCISIRLRQPSDHVMRLCLRSDEALRHMRSQHQNATAYFRADRLGQGAVVSKTHIIIRIAESSILTQPIQTSLPHGSCAVLDLVLAYAKRLRLFHEAEAFRQPLCTNLCIIRDDGSGGLVIRLCTYHIILRGVKA